MATPAASLNNLVPSNEQPEQLSYLENIIDKKVNGVALSCFEIIVDWFLTLFSCFYPSYNQLYQEKLASKIFSSEVSDIERVELDGHCWEMAPCKHEVSVFLKDGRQASGIKSADTIRRLISELDTARINPGRAPASLPNRARIRGPGRSWGPNAVKEHFRI